MRKLSDRLKERERAEADDRDLTSRTDLRREQHARELSLKRLALELVQLKPAQLERLELDPELLESITHAQALEDARAKSRQVGVVRQHLRDQGEAASGIEERLAALKSGTLRSAPPRDPVPEVNEALILWVERLGTEGDAALQDFLSLHPGADRQALRQAARALAKSRQGGLATGAAARAEMRLRQELELWL